MPAWALPRARSRLHRRQAVHDAHMRVRSRYVAGSACFTNSESSPSCSRRCGSNSEGPRGLHVTRLRSVRFNPTSAAIRCSSWGGHAANSAKARRLLVLRRQPSRSLATASDARLMANLPCTIATFRIPRGVILKELRVGAEIWRVHRPHGRRCGKKISAAAAPRAADTLEAGLAPKRAGIIPPVAAVWRDAEACTHAVHQAGLARNPFEDLRVDAEIGHGIPLRWLHAAPGRVLSLDLDQTQVRPIARTQMPWISEGRTLCRAMVEGRALIAPSEKARCAAC